MFSLNIYNIIDRVFNLKKREITEQEIAEIFAKNITRRKYEAADILVTRYLKDIPNTNKNINFINNTSNKSLVDNPKSYARWSILLAAEYIVDYYKKYISYVSYSIRKQEDCVELNFEIPKNDASKNSVIVTIFLAKNGVVVDINNDYISVVKERIGKEFTGNWNVNISNNLKSNLTILDSSNRNKTKVLNNMSK